MTFILGNNSLKELKGVHPDLVAVVTTAIKLSKQDFAVHDGLRTLAEQKALMKAGATRTLNSRHLTGHAVDLVPYINGKLRWEWEPIYQIAEAMREASIQLKIPLRWGGAWDQNLVDPCLWEESTKDISTDYAYRRREAGRAVFLDGPHFELPEKFYP